MKKLKFNTTLKTVISMTLLSTAVGSYGDDTEVFYSVNISKPNVLFVLDNSGSMNYDSDGSSPSNYYSGSVYGFQGEPRLQILKNTLFNVLKVAPSNVNVGLMRYGPGKNTSASPITGGRDESYLTDHTKRTFGVNGITFPLRQILLKISKLLVEHLL